MINEFFFLLVEGESEIYLFEPLWDETEEVSAKEDQQIFLKSAAEQIYILLTIKAVEYLGIHTAFYNFTEYKVSKCKV